MNKSDAAALNPKARERMAELLATEADPQKRTYYEAYLTKHVVPIVRVWDALEERNSFKKLTEQHGCDPLLLVRHVCLAAGIPWRSTPLRESIIPVRLSRLDARIRRICNLALEIDEFNSRGGRNLVPTSLAEGSENLPIRLVRFAKGLILAYEATDGRKSEGPGGLDAYALRLLAQYVNDCAGRPCNDLVVDLLGVVREGGVDERAYRRFVRRSFRTSSIEKATRSPRSQNVHNLSKPALGK